MHRLGARRELMVMVVVRRRALCQNNFAVWRACLGRRVFTPILPGVYLPPYEPTISAVAVESSTSFSRVKLLVKASKKKIA